MKFNQVIKEAAAEVKGQGSNERFVAQLGNKTMEPGELRQKAPNSHKVIMKAIMYAKSKLGLDLSADKQPADVTIKADGSVKIVDDQTGKSVQVQLTQLGFKPEMTQALKAELGV